MPRRDGGGVRSNRLYHRIMAPITRLAVGNGPVNAVDTAIRKALVKVYPQLADVELVDYKVRILPPIENDQRHGSCDACAD